MYSDNWYINATLTAISPVPANNSYPIVGAGGSVPAERNAYGVSISGRAWFTAAKKNVARGDVATPLRPLGPLVPVKNAQSDHALCLVWRASQSDVCDVRSRVFSGGGSTRPSSRPRTSRFQLPARTRNRRENHRRASAKPSSLVHRRHPASRPSIDSPPPRARNRSRRSHHPSTPSLDPRTPRRRVSRAIARVRSTPPRRARGVPSIARLAAMRVVTACRWMTRHTARCKPHTPKNLEHIFKPHMYCTKMINDSSFPGQ